MFEQGVAVRGFGGAFLSGTDPAVTVVVDDEERPPDPVSLCYEGVGLEVSFISSLRLQCAVSVLCDARLADSFQEPNVLADPSGHLTALQERVAREFTNPRWVQVRCADAIDTARSRLAGIDAHDSLANQVLAWTAGMASTAAALLLAACHEPVTRRPYAAVRDLLAERDRLDYHEVLLYLLGSAGLSRGRVESHLRGVSSVCPTTAGDCRTLLDRGLHREAVFGLVVGYGRGLAQMSPAGVEPPAWENDFGALLTDLGVSSYDDRRRRADRVLSGLPELWQVATSLMADRPTQRP
ncbi:hypothetical protein GCM10027569_31740 [Flindersiella endophytica]